VPDAIGLRAVSAPMGPAPYLLPNGTTKGFGGSAYTLGFVEASGSEGKCKAVGAR
jgi:hypothetical protein